MPRLATKGGRKGGRKVGRLEAQSGRPEQMIEKLARTFDGVKKSCTGNVSKAA